MGEHTRGRLKVDQFHGRIYIDTEDTEESNGLHVADVEGDDLISSEVARANARRLVAAWNFCQEATTEELEASKLSVADDKIGCVPRFYVEPIDSPRDKGRPAWVGGASTILDSVPRVRPPFYVEPDSNYDSPIA